MSRTPFDDARDRDEPLEIPPDQDDTRGAHAAVAADESNEMIKLRAERDDLYQRLARLQAEFTNARKRLEADKDQAVQFANSKVIKSLLPVIDNFERVLAVDPAKADLASVLKGMQIVHDQWLAVLAQEKVDVIAPQPGTPFDAERMQALMQQPSEQYKGRKEPIVTQLLQKGYALHGRTLRPAQVAVSATE